MLPSARSPASDASSPRSGSPSATSSRCAVAPSRLRSAAHTRPQTSSSPLSSSSLSRRCAAPVPRPSARPPSPILPPGPRGAIVTSILPPCRTSPPSASPTSHVVISTRKGPIAPFRDRSLHRSQFNVRLRGRGRGDWDEHVGTGHACALTLSHSLLSCSLLSPVRSPKHVRTRPCAHRNTCAHAHARTRTRSQAHTYTYAQTNTHTHACAHTRRRHTNAHTHAGTHAGTRAQKNTYTHAHAQPHTRTPTRPPPSPHTHTSSTSLSEPPLIPRPRRRTLLAQRAQHRHHEPLVNALGMERVGTWGDGGWK